MLPPHTTASQQGAESADHPPRTPPSGGGRGRGRKRGRSGSERALGQAEEEEASGRPDVCPAEQDGPGQLPVSELKLETRDEGVDNNGRGGSSSGGQKGVAGEEQEARVEVQRTKVGKT